MRTGEGGLASCCETCGAPTHRLAELPRSYVYLLGLYLGDGCDLLALHWTTAGNTIYVSRKADVATLDGFVGPKT